MKKGILILLLTSACVMLAQAPKKLTISQIEQLIKVLPDRTLSYEIRQRGVEFKVDVMELNHLQSLGAGKLTLAILADLIPRAVLKINSVPPECDVTVNDQPKGRTDQSGNLRVTDLSPAKALVKINKDGFRSQWRNVDLSVTQETEISVSLERQIGTIKISIDPVDAEFKVHPVGESVESTASGSCMVVAGQDRLLECVPGEYAVEASRTGYQSAGADTHVVDGETSIVSIHLIANLQVVRRLPYSSSASPNSEGGANIRANRTPIVDEDAAKLLARVQSAMGGRDTLTTLKEWKRNATDFWIPNRGSTEATTEFVAPSTLREEARGGNKTVNFSDGVAGWTWSSSRPATSELPRATATGMVFRVLSRLVLSDSDPTKTVSFRPPDTLLISDIHGNSVVLTVDLRSYLPLRVAWRNLDGALLEETYGDWKRIDGVMCWFQMIRSRDGRAFLEERVRKIKINQSTSVGAMERVP